MKSDETLTARQESLISRCSGLTVLVNDEPPIGVGGDPVVVEGPPGTKLDDPPSHLGLTDSFVYTFKSTRNPPREYTRIYEVIVITESDDGNVDVAKYKLPSNENAQLRLWFSNTAEPDFKFEVVRPNATLTIKAELAPKIDQVRKKPHRPYRRDCKNSNLRVTRWALTRNDGTVIIDPIPGGARYSDAGDESYRFYISLDHPH